MNRGKGCMLAAAALGGLSATGANVRAKPGVGTILIVQTRVTICCLLMPPFFAMPNLLCLRAADLWCLILVEMSDAP
jgi:hypothetical protein